jgi:hypothetical protein
MSTLTSSSTYAQVLAEYDDNASWEEDASLSKAKAFLTACRFLLRYAKVQSRTGRGTGASQEMDYDTIRSEMNEARAFVADQEASASSSTNPSVTHADWQALRV